MYISYLSSPIGNIKITSTDRAITGVSFVASKPKSVGKQKLPSVLTKCVQELEEYFKGTRKKFTVPVEESGTVLQTKVWNTLKTIPYGGISTYSAVAKDSKNTKAVRATGTAIGKNEIVIIVPCHRVVAKDGGLGGYSAGLHRKKWLLKHEGVLKD